MRMTALELVADALENVVEREMSGLGSDLCVEYDLEGKIAKLVSERTHVVARDRVGDFIGFLDRVRRDARETLRAIPFAAMLWVAQALHNQDQSFEGHVAP